MGLKDNAAVQPEKVLAWRVVLEEGHYIREWLVRWQGMPAKDSTGETKLLLQSQFPSFSLKDKTINDVVMIEASRVLLKLNGLMILVDQKVSKPMIRKVYTCKKKRVKGNTAKLAVS